MVGRSRSGNNLHFAWARCRAAVSGSQPAPKSFLISSIWARGWCCGGSCSSATSAVANASVTTHSSWPVIPFLGISPPQRLVSPVNGPASREISADSEMKASKTVHPTRDARKLRKPGRAGSAPRLEAEDARPSTIRADLRIHRDSQDSNQKSAGGDRRAVS